MKKDFKNVKFLLESISYARYNWQLCGDFKMIGFLKGLQGGYTQHSCFLCLWDSRAVTEHYSQKDWPERRFFMPGIQNVKHDPLVDSEKIVMPPLHIKLGLVKQFVKAMNKEGNSFQHISALFPFLSEANKEAGSFTGPQVRLMLQCKELEDKMTAREAGAWKAFREVVQNFLGNKQSNNYELLVNNLMEEYKTMGCCMSLKMHFLHSHLDFFSRNMGDVSEEHGERFHQDISDMERRYQGRWNCNMMGDYLWSIVREDFSVHRHKSRKHNHF